MGGELSEGQPGKARGGKAGKPKDASSQPAVPRGPSRNPRTRAADAAAQAEFARTGKRICGAKARSAADPAAVCHHAPTPGSNRCARHRGTTDLRGPLAPNYKDGRWSRYLPTPWQETYAQAVASPELENLRDDLAALEVLMGDTLQQLGVTMEERELLAEMSTAGETPPDGWAAALASVQAAEARLRRQFLDQLEARRRLVETNSKVGGAIPRDQVQALVWRIMEIARRHVTDRTMLVGMAADMRALLAGSGQAWSENTPGPEARGLLT